MLEHIYLAVQSQIMKHTDIRFVDLDYGQYEFDTRPAASFPSVLIDFDQLQYQDLGDNVQECSGLMILRLGVAEYSPSSSSTPELWKHKGLEHFRQETRLHAALHGVELGIDPSTTLGASLGTCSVLTRVSSATERREDNLRIRVLTYAFRYEDYSTADPSQMKTVDYDIDIDLETDNL